MGAMKPGGGTVTGAAITAAGGVLTTRTIAGLDLSADRTAAAMRTALAGVTDYDFTSSTGWTLENGTVGSGSATITSGVARLAIGSSGTCAYIVGDASAPRLRRALPTLRDPWRFRVEVRIADPGSGGTGNNIWHLVLGLRNPSGTVRGVNLRIGFDGRPDAVTHNGATQLATGGGSEITLTGGNAYVALEVDRSILRVLYGTGSGSTRPTTWTQQYQTSVIYTALGISQGGSAAAPAPLSEVFLALERTFAAVGVAASIDFDDLRVIDLSPL